MKTADKTITATEFKAKCLKILDELTPSGLIVTKKGRPVAKVTPIPSANNEQLIGSMKHLIQIKGDILSTGVRWNAQS
jgi:prevent-host-death family protein